MVKKSILAMTMAGIFLLAAALGLQAQNSDIDQAAQAVVRIRGCDASGCDRGVGSGVIIDPSGVILTANHVTLSDPNDPLSDPLNDFVIEMTTDWRAVPVARYRAGLAASDRTDDLALLQIYWDEIEQGDVQFSDLALPALPLDGLGAVDLGVDLGERLHFLGYPLLGGATINYLDLALSGNDGDQDSLLKVPGVLSPGYSGGPALIRRGDGFYVIGIVIRQRYAQGSERASGQVSLIRSVGALPGLDWTPAARRVWVDDVIVAAVDSSDAPFYITLDLRALDFAGRPVRAMAYAYDAASGEPWTPQRSDLPTTAAGQVVLSADFEFAGFVGERRVALRVPKRALVDVPDELAFRIVLWDAAGERAVWRDTEWRRPQAAKGEAANSTTWQWLLSLLSVIQATAVPTVEAVTVSTAMPTAVSTPAATPIQPASPLSPPPATPSRSPATVACSVVTQALRLRTGPGTTFVAKGMLDIGTDVAVLSRDPGVAWIEVRTQSGLSGWVYNSSAYVACDGAVAELPIGDISPLPRPAPARLPAAPAGPTAVELLTPDDGANSRDPLTFSWQPDSALVEGQVYELVFWEPSKGQDHERGGSWQDASMATSVTLDPAQHAPETYAWGVWLGAFDANGQYKRIRYLGGGRSFTVPSGDGNRGK